ncbi:4-amino-4-deoxy-L-arabinose transferase-like glycosyltransferase [Mycolicibacterium sp. BK634]|uniref:ArnT family glycosyltransferase n=1 Tax=Mycolicibacterium sp. BK634 TaxID=2587099 RepID=UPI00160E4AC4|nr:glycosyltransferase family 39 protein [Mycolicibacterium sp. BK634]MBB3749117.1 4-amino-4-deoxy-L-arabinose transferase-like glycosyltransferase [Mycolicibacterium sp. BK634]
MTTLQERPTLVTPAEPAPVVRPRWARPALFALLAVTAALYLWGLDAAGWANEYYAAAVQAGTQSWKALLFGSIDAGNAITVDKPPAALWVMALSGRIFGFGTLSMLVPQALMGVGSVALIYGAVRRVSGYGAGLLAGAVLALTPVAALMFRFNNPDALLVLLMVIAGYCLIRALDGRSTRWIALAGVAIGFAFLAKLLQALLVTPALALVVLVAVPGSVWLRLRDLAVGLVAIVVSAGWYLALVSLWPSDSRPYIGGSTNNSLLQLALGYNGLGRVFGGDGNPGGSSDSGGGPGGMGGSPMFGGSTGITRMFGESMGTEISWLLPAALIGLIAGLWFTRRAPRTDRTRASLLLWGGWLVVTVVVFSFMKGIMHPYYTIALAPAIGAVLGISVRELWRGKQFVTSRVVLGVMLVVTGVWNFILLDRTPDWLPWLRWVVLIGSILVTAVLLAGAHRLGRWTVALAAAGLLFGLGATAAYTVETIAGNHGGGIPTSGPARAGGGFGFGGPGGPGGQQASDNAELKGMLTKVDNRWAAATVGSHVAGSLELSTGTSIMSIGGFSGGDNSPTLDQFQAYVASGQVRYFIAGNGPGGGHGGGPGGDSGSGSQITQWVQQHFSAQDVGGTEVYDLSMPN